MSAGGCIVRSVARLSARERAGLPDKAFAYIDATGARRLPVHDEAHVRSALGRFGQVRFESDEARDRARERLLSACKRHGIMPVGFVTSQLKSASGPVAALPSGAVTFLLTDMEGSTALLQQLDHSYAGLLRDVRATILDAVRASGGTRVDAHGDEFFAVFEDPVSALEAAVAMQRAMAARRWTDGVQVRVRAGVHTGRPDLTDSGYVGLSVHTVARIASVAHGGQVLVSGQTHAAIETMPAGFSLVSLGAHRLADLPRETELYQIAAEGLLPTFPPLRVRWSERPQAADG
jgi:class 3 adenylate cyclase